MSDIELDPTSCLPDDGTAGTLIGRCWVPGAAAGPAVVAVRADGVFDLSERFATVSDALDESEPAQAVKATQGRRLGALNDLLRNTGRARRDADDAAPAGADRSAGDQGRRRHLRASLLERVIEEQAKGDPPRPTACAPRLRRPSAATSPR